MPIRDEALEARGNEYIAVRGQTTLRQAVALLNSPEVNGKPWWHLVVAKRDGTWAAGKIADLVKATNEDELDIPLDELDWLHTAKVIEQTEMGTGEARDEAWKAPGKVLVVTDDGELAGILYVGAHMGEGEIQVVLTELAGSPVDLREYRDLLIKERGPKEKTAQSE